MANRNRSAGNAYECKIAQELRELGYEAATSRSESRSLDAKGVDLVSNFPLQTQMKTSCNQPNFHKLLTETEAQIVFWQKTEKAGSRFMAQNEYIVMAKEDFYRVFT